MHIHIVSHHEFPLETCCRFICAKIAMLRSPRGGYYFLWTTVDTQFATKLKSYSIKYLRWKGLSRGHKRCKYLSLFRTQSPFSNSETPMEPFPQKHLAYKLNLLFYRRPICIRPGNNTNTTILNDPEIARKSFRWPHMTMRGRTNTTKNVAFVVMWKKSTSSKCWKTLAKGSVFMSCKNDLFRQFVACCLVFAGVILSSLKLGQLAKLSA